MNKQFDIYNGPLSEDTKKIRRNLLIASCVCVFIGISEQLPTSFALWGAKLDSNQQPLIGWFIFTITSYLYLHFISSAGVEIAKWIQPFYESLREKEKLLKHPAFDETDWIELLDSDDPHNIEHVQKMATAEARYYVSNKLRHLYRLIYIQLAIEAIAPIIIGGYALIVLAVLIFNMPS